MEETKGKKHSRTSCNKCPDVVFLFLLFEEFMATFVCEIFKE